MKLTGNVEIIYCKCKIIIYNYYNYLVNNLTVISFVLLIKKRYDVNFDMFWNVHFLILILACRVAYYGY